MNEFKILSQKAIRKRLLLDKVMVCFSVAFSIIGIALLFWILITVLVKGLSGFRLEIFTAPTAFGGLGNAFLGQLELVVAASIVGIPIGVLAGVYLSEYENNQKLANFIRNISDICMSTPSIVIGAFAYAILVDPFNSYNGFAGAFALSVMMMPIVLKTTDDMLSLVPRSLREASYALGATKFMCISGILFKAAKNGLLTGIILAVARVAGETAPLLFTSANSDFWDFSLTRAVPSLTVSIYDFSSMPNESLNSVAWAGAFVLALVVLGVNILARTLIRDKGKK